MGLHGSPEMRHQKIAGDTCQPEKYRRQIAALSTQHPSECLLAAFAVISTSGVFWIRSPHYSSLDAPGRSRSAFVYRLSGVYDKFPNASVGRLNMRVPTVPQSAVQPRITPAGQYQVFYSR